MDTPWIIVIKSIMVEVSGSWEMQPALVYQGEFSLLAMAGDGDPDITEPGTCKVHCKVRSIAADSIRVDPNTATVYEDHAE